MTDTEPRPTTAEWAAAVLATLPRLTDEQWNRANATLGLTTAPQPHKPVAEDAPDRPTGAAA